MNIMLLTDIPPCTNFTAGIVILELVKSLLKDGHSLKCAAIMDPSLNPEIPENISSHLKIQFYEKPRENWGHNKFGEVKSFVMNNYHANVTLNKISSQIKDDFINYNFDIIWSVIQGQTMIKLVRKVSSKFGLEYVSQVWDPPEWWLKEFKFDNFTHKSVMNEFSRLLKDSKCCLAASWNMSEFYSKEYSSKCIPVVPGIQDKFGQPVMKNECTDEFVIGFAGQIYASTEWNALVAALDIINWEHNGKKIIVELFGRAFNLYFNNKANIVLNGWDKQDNVLMRLKEFDLLYCPYFFSEDYKLVSKYSFPSKLTSYFSTGVPVLVHGPNYASPVEFIIRNGAGYVCNSLDPNAIAEVIKSIIESNSRHEVGLAGYQAFLNNLTDVTMKQSFYKALGIEE